MAKGKENNEKNTSIWTKLWQGTLAAGGALAIGFLGRAGAEYGDDFTKWRRGSDTASKTKPKDHSDYKSHTDYKAKPIIKERSRKAELQEKFDEVTLECAIEEALYKRDKIKQDREKLKMTYHKNLYDTANIPTLILSYIGTDEPDFFEISKLIGTSISDESLHS